MMIRSLLIISPTLNDPKLKFIFVQFAQQTTVYCEIFLIKTFALFTVSVCLPLILWYQVSSAHICFLEVFNTATLLLIFHSNLLRQDLVAKQLSVMVQAPQLIPDKWLYFYETSPFGD